ncbi:6-phosphogluconate dehydrogenase [Lepidopterella palustris CBS 459.81]|uniref:phosphogluconate dehydrogenase (NADP(+)-dependent, decarboxylating) n=1 Tax=Lepidopterella palustris CBS 459.81 TaxID=1314670 RepID=A0A8E2DX89_9PEZI|nr:6-phosphogluconate dehydrogenase [Lepidopterella palustris CBS 459.81]
MANLEEIPFKRIGIISAGSLGSMMSLDLAEKGYCVSIWDVNSGNTRGVLEKAQQTGPVKKKIECFYNIKSFAESFGNERKLLRLSISHGLPVDEVLGMLSSNKALKEGDVVLDGGNKHYRATESRRRSLKDKGVSWIGMGVSGAYQSARRGPSLSPGGDEAAVRLVLPVIEHFAAKIESKDGLKQACVEYIGPGGAGHFVKMVHNGIEEGMLGIICEAWGLMAKGLEMDEDQIGQVFEQWNKNGELKRTYLLQTGSEICHKHKTPSGDNKGEGRGEHGLVLNDILDKVVQDDDDTEGTGYWSVMEAADRHVSAPTIAAAQFLRVAIGNRAAPQPRKFDMNEEERGIFVCDLHRGVYARILASYCQGLDLIARASSDEGWRVDLVTCIRIWRSGCIIRCDQIADMLEPILMQELAAALHDNIDPLKRVVLDGVQWDAYVPTLSASLEYLKYEGGVMLLTQFMEAEMDLFGAHSFDHPGVEGEDPGKTGKGSHHYEWKPARTSRDSGMSRGFAFM